MAVAVGAVLLACRTWIVSRGHILSVGDRVALALDDDDGVVTKIQGAWVSVRLDDDTIEKFRSTELRY